MSKVARAGLWSAVVATVVVSATFQSVAYAQYPIAEFKGSITNKASLQRGAKYFINYCLSCHSTAYSRYNRVAKDLNLTDDMVREHLIFTKQKLRDLMNVSMTDEEAIAWFGVVIPDLTLIARSRTPAWVYTYLKTFYLDDSRPMGVNNAVSQNVAMPHVLWRLQGWQRPVYADKDNETHDSIVGFKVVEEGALSPEEYDQVVTDIVSFLMYLAEPSALKRESIGVGVMLFLLVLLLVVYFLKREYWRDIH